MNEYVDKILDWVKSTNVNQQITDVDYVGLFTNPWFMVPAVTIILYLLYKQDFRNVIILGIFGGVWWATGTDYMASLIVNGEIVIEKILPVVFGGAIVLGLVIYLLFGRSD